MSAEPTREPSILFSVRFMKMSIFQYSQVSEWDKPRAFSRRR